MTFELTPQTIITTGAVITAAVLLIQRFAKGVRWFDQQEKQTTDIAALKAKHEADMKAMKQILAEDMHGINEEQTSYIWRPGLPEGPEGAGVQRACVRSNQ